MADEKPPRADGLKVWTAKSSGVPVFNLVKRLLGRNTPSPKPTQAIPVLDVHPLEQSAVTPLSTNAPILPPVEAAPRSTPDNLHQEQPESIVEKHAENKRERTHSENAKTQESNKAIKRGPTKTKLRAERKRIKKEKFTTEVTACARKHVKTLYYKKRILLTPDDYGRINRAAWDSELDYFIDHVLPKRIATRKTLTRRELRRGVDRLVQDYEPDAEDFKPNLSDPRGFEDSVRGIFEKCGWNARLTPATGDQGVDVVASKNGLSVAVQCKLYSSPVGNSAVQEVMAGKLHYRCEFAIVVTTTTFTPSARKLAVSTGVELLHYSNLQRFIVGIEEQRRAKH